MVLKKVLRVVAFTSNSLLGVNRKKNSSCHDFKIVVNQRDRKMSFVNGQTFETGIDIKTEV